jgi:hypothetical protein
MKDVMSEIDLEELRSELDDFANPTGGGAGSAKEQRIIAGFEEVERFIDQHGRLPQHGEGRDIFERIYAVRLDRLRTSQECLDVLHGRDPRGLLESSPKDMESAMLAEDAAVYQAGGALDAIPSVDDLAAELSESGLEASDISQLQHVRSRGEIRAAEEVAKRNPCADFETFRPLFERVKLALKSGERRSVKYQDNAAVTKGNLFILDGQTILVADEGEEFVSDYGKLDRRLRVVYENATESDLLLRSLQRALNKDKTSRRITEPDLGPLFSDEAEENDLPTGRIYVLRSLSNHDFVAANRSVIHKIGVTAGNVKSRIGNAKKDPTFLLAEVEIVAVFELSNINGKRLEAMIHRFFGGARLDVELKDHFGSQVEPREWFLVPLAVIEEFIHKLKAGTLSKYRYDLKTATMVPVAE